MTAEKDTAWILKELEPVVEERLNWHLDKTSNWNPHDYVPWSDGHNFYALGGEDWEPTQSKLGEAAMSAMYVNLLTEDNLPSYHRVIAKTFGYDEDNPWTAWVNRWTAEEGRHSIAMRDFLVVTRAIDPVNLEQARIDQVTQHFNSDKSPLEAMAYVTMQELATRIAHRNTGLESEKDGEPLANNLLKRIALDENYHMIFYRELVKAAFEVAPNDMMQAVAKEVMNFQMPGTTIREFGRHAVTIANAGIYDVPLHALEVVKPTMKLWNIEKRTDVTGEGAEAQEKLGRFLNNKLYPLANNLVSGWKSKSDQHPYLPLSEQRDI